jgi:NAD(P)-dependent dehydrogenase (short-subunit alcohol dehydrogenase family)
VSRARPRKLDGKVAVVTGASSGIGRAIAWLYAAEGARVALIARDLVGLEDAASEIRSRGGQAMVLPLDVSQWSAVGAAADRVVSAWGKIDVWVNDATVSVLALAHETTPDEYRRVMEVNYLGYVHGTLAALRHMRPRNAGLIVQVGSELTPIPLQSANSASAAAIHGFTESLRGELRRARSGIQATHLQHAEPHRIAGAALRAALRPKHALGLGAWTIRAIARRGSRSNPLAGLVRRLERVVRRRPGIGLWLSGLTAGAAMYLFARGLWTAGKRS